jgi:hypothetical protein
MALCCCLDDGSLNAALDGPFRRLARDYERLAETLVGLHFVAFAILMAHRFVTFMVQSA